MDVLVMEVAEAALAWVYKDDHGFPVAAVAALGRVNTGGWSGAKLTVRSISSIPIDVILDFDFTAAPPAAGTVVTDAVVSHNAIAILALPPGITGARVNSLGAPLIAKVMGKASVSDKHTLDGLPVPWPFPWFFQKYLPE
jgi:hypothetical protein